ncbi:MAG: hypothetical protein AABZ53_03815 [Planctomycetota bacterium]|mgnify:CR=1 FL=1
MRPPFLTPLALASLALATASGAQPPAPSSPPVAPAAQPAAQVTPPIKLGLRINGVREKLPVAPVVVVVADLASYAQAIGLWRVNLRFPVLIDDGSPGSRENIGRFVRAFAPTRVVRWSGGGTEMKDTVAITATIDNAVGRAWTIDGKEPQGGFTTPALLAQFKTLGLEPPGVVVAAKDDAAWPAALALAAGHGQPIFWTKSSRRLDASLSASEADAFEKSIEAFCASTGLAWKDLGDVIEGVTLCMSSEATVKTQTMGNIATTDRIGRGSGGARDTGRWAWCAQIPGNPAGSSYMAMCSLFLQEPKRAWLFDSYPTTGDWNNYDCTVSGEILTKAGITATVTDSPNGNEKTWRSLVNKAVVADLILVNTKGNKDFFELSSGVGKLGDVPIMGQPAAVHFVHSWSAQYIGTRDTIAGRWLERGVSFYAGSVEEPNLSGFVPTPQVALRAAIGVPLGAAVRFDTAPAWKITTLGDPFKSFGKRGPAAAIPALDGAIDLAEAVKSQVKSDPALALVSLVMLGRDDDAARLLAALASQPESLKPEAVVAGGLALFRTGKSADLFMALQGTRPGALAKAPELRDAAWAAAGPALVNLKDRAALAWFASAVRPEQIARDMDDLADGAKRIAGVKEAISLAQQARDAQKDPGRKAEADKAFVAVRARLGG